MTKTFISYRRADSQETTDYLHNQMCQHFGEHNVFQDVDNIPFGVDFRKYLRDEIAKCDVVLVIIGKDWVRIMAERAHEPSDFVRIEVESALKLGKLVIPVTVRGAEMPKPDQLPESVRDLCWLNRAVVRPNPDFKHDCQRLADGIKRAIITTAVVSRIDLLSACQRAEIFARDTFSSGRIFIKPATDTTEGGEIIILGRSKERGDNEGYIDAEVEGSEVDISFNLQELIEILKNSKSEEVTLKFEIKSSEGILYPFERGGFIIFASPMN